jgi:hypothetical protein
MTNLHCLLALLYTSFSVQVASADEFGHNHIARETADVYPAAAANSYENATICTCTNTDVPEVQMTTSIDMISALSLAASTSCAHEPTPAVVPSSSNSEPTLKIISELYTTSCTSIITRTTTASINASASLSPSPNSCTNHTNQTAQAAQTAQTEEQRPTLMSIATQCENCRFTSAVASGSPCNTSSTHVCSSILGLTFPTTPPEMSYSSKSQGLKDIVQSMSRTAVFGSMAWLAFIM